MTVTDDAPTDPLTTDPLTTAPLTEPPADGVTHGVARLLRREPRLRRLITAQAVSQLGDWSYNVALLVTVYAMTGSAGLLALTTAARILPDFLAGPIGGLLSDRHDRRRLMVACDLARAGLMAAFAVVVLLGLSPWLFPVLAAATSLVGAPYRACVAATISRMVPAEDLPAANGARTITSEASVILGPLLESVFLLLHSPAAAFGLNAASFAVSATLVLAIPREPFLPQTTQAYRGIVAELASGLRALREDARILPVVGADVLGSGVYGLVTVLLLLFTNATTGGSVGYPLLMTASGVGGVIGGFGASRVMARLSANRVLALGLVATAGTAVALGLATVVGSYWAAVLPVALLGGAGILVEIQADTAMQTLVPDDVFGRVYGIAVPTCFAAQALGSGIAPTLTTAFGLTGAFLGSGVLVLGYLGWLTRRVLRRRTAVAAAFG